MFALFKLNHISHASELQILMLYLPIKPLYYTSFSDALQEFEMGFSFIILICLPAWNSLGPAGYFDEILYWTVSLKYVEVLLK
jgi:hypothetical protein